MFRPLWIEIKLENLRKNLSLVRRYVGESVKILATVKQNAYGHGLIRIAKELDNLGVNFFGVGSLEEAIALRECGIKKPILVLTALLPSTIKLLIKYRVKPTVVDLAFARRLDKEAKRLAKKVDIHIKVDTGMGRLGVWWEDAKKFICKVCNLKNLYVEGLFTHFPSADTDYSFTTFQIKSFNTLIKECAKEGIFFRYLHSANSIALIKYKSSHFNLVRPGLILYGINPYSRMNIELAPLLSLKSKVIFLKKVDRGRSISYGRTYITKRPTTIATVGCGYADGYPFVLSNRGKVIIKGEFFNIVGRVCMDHFMIDIGSNEKIKIRDTVTLIGKEKNAYLKAEDLAGWANTIPYEIVSRLSLSIPRIYK
ncbi:MAG: alanine racemase [Candidatus Omnitrophica bacterium]|nr:alanine racemase [Candidatus Omnitrophota bacterium]